MLEALENPQLTTLINTENTIAHKFIYDNLNLKKLKSCDMKYFWLRDRGEKKQSSFLWDYGDQNDGFYFTKHHLPHYHKYMRTHYIQNFVSNLFRKVVSIYMTN